MASGKTKFTPLSTATHDLLKGSCYLSFQCHIICESNPLTSCAELFQARPSVFVINGQIVYHCE